MTFREVAEMYVQQPTKKYARKQKHCVQIVEKICEKLGDEKITKFQSKRPVLEYITQVRNQKSARRANSLVSNGYVNSHIVFLRAILVFARDELEIIDRVPLIKTLTEKKRDTYLTPEQVRNLMRWLDELRADMVEFAVNTGLRNSNVRLLRWSDLSEDFSSLYVKAEDSKNGEPTAIPLNKDAQRVLRRRHQKSKNLEDRYPYLKGKIDYVFAKESNRRSANGKPYADCKAVSGRNWRKACRQAGLPDDVVFHTLRHTFASWHLQSGTSESTLQELGNWQSERSMKRYGHLSMKFKQEAAANINGLLRSDL